MGVNVADVNDPGGHQDATAGRRDHLKHVGGAVAWAP